MPDLTQPDHLPHRRTGGEPPPKRWLPRQRRGTTPQMIGRYPDYDVFDAEHFWDAATRRVIEQRMRAGAEGFRFFLADELPALRRFTDILLAQDEDPRVPVPEMIDAKLAAGHLDGYQYADLPDDRDTWHLVLRGLEDSARRDRGTAFADLPPDEAERIVRRFSGGELNGPAWTSINQQRAWSVCLRMVLSAFYSHPWAWNEIGFGGPAYPRGYERLGPVGTREPFERAGATDEDPVEVADILERQRP